MIDWLEENILLFVLFGSIFLILLSLFLVIFLISRQRQIYQTEMRIQRIEYDKMPRIEILENEKQELDRRLKYLEGS